TRFGRARRFWKSRLRRRACWKPCRSCSTEELPSRSQEQKRASSRSSSDAEVFRRLKVMRNGTGISMTRTARVVLLTLLTSTPRSALAQTRPAPDLASATIEELMKIVVTTASRGPEGIGSASALYGADAFSAVVNIISKKVADAPGLSASASVGQFGLYNQTASYGAQLGSNVSLMLAGQTLYDRQPDLSKYYPAVFRGLAGQHSGTFDTIFGPMTPSQPIAPDYEAPLSAHSFEAVLRAGGLDVMLFNNHSRVSTTPAVTPENGAYSADAFIRNNLLVAAASYTRPIGPVTSTSTVTFSRHDLDPQSGYRNVFTNMEKSYKYSYGRMAKGEEQFSWKPTPSMTMTTGGTFERF